MSEYYAVQRSGDSLAHYGVRGMKWGVKKALTSGSDKKLNKQFVKAQNKLRKLEDKADLSRQKAAAKEHGKKAVRSAAVGAVTGAFSVGAQNQYAKNAIKDSRIGKIKYLGGGYAVPTGKASTLWGGATLASSAVSRIAGVKSAYHLGKAVAAAHRSTKKGHAKAAKKASEFRSEMKKAFAGTKYANGASAQSPKKTKKRRASTRG